MKKMLLWIGVGVGVVIVGVLGLFAYMSATATPLHPDAEKVSTVSRSRPPAKWERAAKQGREIIRAGLIEQNLPGLSVAVGMDGELVWAEGFGLEDLESQVPVGPDTRFRIGTTSMALTSAAVGLLVERNQLKLDENIRTYVPAFPEKQWPVTVGQLMKHQAGIRPDEEGEELVTAHCAQTLDGLQRFANDPLLFEPGTNYRRSIFGWTLVSAAVEAAGKRPFPEFMQKEVFEPMGLHDTSMYASTKPVPGQATYYFPRFAANPRYGPQAPDPVDFSCFSGANAFVSTPSDLVRFAIALNGGKFLRIATAQFVQGSEPFRPGTEPGYEGAGWDAETVSIAGKKTEVTSQDGVLMGGNVSSLMIFREYPLIVAVTSNMSFADTALLARKVAQSFAESRRP